VKLSTELKVLCVLTTSDLMPSDQTSERQRIMTIHDVPRLMWIW